MIHNYQILNNPYKYMMITQKKVNFCASSFKLLLF